MYNVATELVSSFQNKLNNVCFLPSSENLKCPITQERFQDPVVAAGTCRDTGFIQRMGDPLISSPILSSFSAINTVHVHT